MSGSGLGLDTRVLRFASAAIAFAASLTISARVSAQAPTAVVEEIKGTLPGIEMMDYLSAGKIINLGADDTIILSYLKSCRRETITGANVTVGIDQSDVQGGTVDREKTSCDSGKMDNSAELGRGGAMVFRDGPKTPQPPPLSLRPQFKLYGLSPVVELETGKPVLIERVDQPGERYELSPDGRKMRGVFYDFADDNKALVRAGVYRATMGRVQVLFQVDPEAQPGRSPLAGRLLRLKGSN